MSVTAKVTLGLAVAFSASIIFYVHESQKREKERLRQGVVRDVQRQELKKQQNLLLLQQQHELEKSLRRQQAELATAAAAAGKKEGYLEKKDI